MTHFYPRPPRGGRRLQVHSQDAAGHISIHALREEGDLPGQRPPLWQQISIHALREEGDLPGQRPPLWQQISIHALREEGDKAPAWRFVYSEYFYPRPPRGGRPDLPVDCHGSRDISIHALREEGDRAAAAQTSKQTISIHALREEGDGVLWGLGTENPYFYPRPPRGGRQQKQRENPLLLSHYTPLCTNCKDVPVKQTAKSHRYLRKRLVFRCEASGKTMCAACSHWRGIKRSAHYPAQTPGAAQHARP